jgi:enamine deaminase RidA (YjgF/YER057c/UK114 family)
LQTRDCYLLDYDPPRAYAAGARVGNVVYLAGEDGKTWTGPRTWTIPDGGIEAQAERMWQSIQHNLRRFGSDLEYIFKTTTYYVDFEHRDVAAAVRRRYLTRTVPGTSVQVSRLSDPAMLIEVEVTALVPGEAASAAGPAHGAQANDPDDRTSMEILRSLSPETAAAFSSLRAAVDRSGPLDRKVIALVACGGFVASRNEIGFRSHCRRALEAGARPEEIYQTILVALGFSQGIAPVAAAIRWADEVIRATTAEP